jgi:hypothetical protein
MEESGMTENQENIGYGRQLLRDALNHHEGKVPIDFGSTAVTGMHVKAVAALREYYGLEPRLVKAFEPYQMLGWLDEDLLEAMGVHVSGVFARGTFFGFPNENWQPFTTPWGQEVLVSEHFRTTSDGAGGYLIYPCGDTTAPASGHMPASGYFFDTIIRQEPIDEDTLDPEDNLEEFAPISGNDLAYFKSQISKLAFAGRGLIASFGGTAIGDIALVPAPFLKHPKGIRDITEWYMSTAIRQDYLHQVFTKQTEIALVNLSKIHAAVGSAVDALFICGTDFGTQTGSFCSPETFCSLYAPYYRQINSWIHKQTAWKTFKHSCGAVEPFIPLLIDAGFDILNPVQCSAAGMDPRVLKARYGDHIVFWGGGTDTQRTLSFGTPQQVRDEVLNRCEIFAPGGGFVFNAVHNVQATTPVENIAAMLAAVKEFNGDA